MWTTVGQRSTRRREPKSASTGYRDAVDVDSTKPRRVPKSVSTGYRDTVDMDCKPIRENGANAPNTKHENNKIQYMRISVSADAGTLSKEAQGCSGEKDRQICYGPQGTTAKNNNPCLLDAETTVDLFNGEGRGLERSVAGGCHCGLMREVDVSRNTEDRGRTVQEQ